MSRSPDNILLQLAADHDAKVRDILAQLAARGFPAQHQSPHISITFSPQMDAPAVRQAASLLPELIPANFQRVGTVIFGTKRKQTVAWLLETTQELEAAARTISAANPAGRGQRWVPHLSMGLRLPREIVPGYLQALDEITGTQLRELHATRAVLWKPRLNELTALAGEEMPAGHLGASNA